MNPEEGSLQVTTASSQAKVLQGSQQSRGRLLWGTKNILCYIIPYILLHIFVSSGCINTFEKSKDKDKKMRCTNCVCTYTVHLHTHTFCKPPFMVPNINKQHPFNKTISFWSDWFVFIKTNAICAAWPVLPSDMRATANFDANLFHRAHVTHTQAIQWESLLINYTLRLSNL